MLELFTPVAIAALSASQFVITELSKGAASEAGKKLVVELWDKLKEKFEKNDKATRAMLTIEKEGSQKEPSKLAVYELSKLAVYIDDEMQDSSDFATELHQLVQKIINSDKSQHQQQTNNVTTANVSGYKNIGVLNNIGDGPIVQRDQNITNNNITNNNFGKIH